MPNLLTAIVATALLTSGPDPAYYNGVFSNHTRESPYILVRVKLKDELRTIVAPNAEFSRILRKQLKLDEHGYIKFMSSSPVKNNTVLIDKYISSFDNSLLIGNCQTHKMGSADSERALIASYSQKVGANTVMKLPKNHDENNCIISIFIKHNYIITTDDESGALLVKKSAR